MTLTDFNNKEIFRCFFEKYMFSLIDNKGFLKLFKNNGCSAKEYDIFIDEVIDKNKIRLKRLQLELNKILDYCIFNVKSQKLKKMQPIDRLFVLKHITPNSRILFSNKIKQLSMVYLSELNNLSDIPELLESKLVDSIINKRSKFKTMDVMIPDNMEQILYFGLTSVLKTETLIRNCQLCNKYFIASHVNQQYCDSAAPGCQGKTCQQVGAKLTYNDRIKEDEAIKLYMKIYANKAYLAHKNKDIDIYIKDYDVYKKIGKLKLSAYKKNKLSKDAFIKWITENQQL